LHLQHDAAILRQPLFADVELRHDLETRGNRVLQLEWRVHDQLQNAIDAEAHAEFFFVGLHVNVARSALHSVGQHQVHQLDDGSFIGRFLQLFQFQFLLFGLDLDIGRVAELVHRLHDAFELFFFARAVCLLDTLHDRAFRSHHRFDVEPGHELDVVHGENIGGIDHGDGEGCAYAAEGQDLVALGGFERNQLDDRGINFEIGEIDGGDAILAGEKIGDILVGKKSQLHERGGEAAVRLLLQFARLI